MSRFQRPGTPRLSVVIPDNRKHDPLDYEQTASPGNGGNLSPDLQPATPPTYPIANSPLLEGHPLVESVPQAYKIGNYILSQQTDTVGDIRIYRAYHCDTREEYVCKVVCIEKFRETFSAYFTVGYHEHINEIEEIIYGASEVYVLFARHYGDLHSYVRRRRRLREGEAWTLFRQIMLAVQHCHSEGLVLRDLKLRKFVFKNPQKTELKLECIEDAFVVGEDQNDCLADKHGCPAYVSPEILQCEHSYSGRAADMWSSGVMLYTLLVGRYPFHDVQPNALFSKIRRGDYRVPDSVSARAKCLVRALLRKHPSERLSAEEVLEHPWFRYGGAVRGGSSSNKPLAPAAPPAVANKQGNVAGLCIASELADHSVPSSATTLTAPLEQEPLPWFS